MMYIVYSRGFIHTKKGIQLKALLKPIFNLNNLSYYIVYVDVVMNHYFLGVIIYIPSPELF